MRDPGRARSSEIGEINRSDVQRTHDLSFYTGAVGLPLLVLVLLSLGAVKQFNGRHHWIFALAVAVLFVARGIGLGRPLVIAHVAGSAALVVVSALTQGAGYGGVALVLLASSGLVLMWPTASRPQPELLQRVSQLVDRTVADPLAPFAMHSYKSYFFTQDKAAAVGYHTRLGVAVVSGDPIGDPEQFVMLAAQFRRFCMTRGWRIAVLGASERHLGLWTAFGASRTFRAVPVGRDVVVDVGHFDMVGRQFRNLRQAVNRTRNAGVTTEVISEREITDQLRTELLEIAGQTRGGRTQRGFSMILDHALDGRYPGMLVVLARDADGVVQGFARYAVAGHGTEISLDLPWRRPGAPNGIDERLSVAMVEYAREHGGKRVSLAFAAFPELFDNEKRGWAGRTLFTLIHLGDSVLALESLYRYLKKFHALGERRYVLVDFAMLPIAAFALLTLEFVPRRA